MSEKFQPSEHDLKLADQNREEIQDPEKIGAIKTLKAKESFRENEGKLLLSPEGLMPENISAVVGARSSEKGAIEWTDKVFTKEAGIDPTKTIRVQQGHTGNVVEVHFNQAPALDLIKDETGKVVEDKRLKTADGAKVDAAWTKDKDLTLMIGSADCAAVTIAGKDRDGKDIVGIAHSGIAGAQKDITGNLIREMIEKGQGEISSFKVYVAPSVCEKCFSIISEGEQQEKIDKAKTDVTVTTAKGEEKVVNLTLASASFVNFSNKYGEKFKELFGRELNQNDLFYVAQNENGAEELHYRIDNQIYISLLCNGVGAKNIGFSEVCTKNDGLPSYQRTGETTGVYSTITIKKPEESESTDELERRRIEKLWNVNKEGYIDRSFDKYVEILMIFQEFGEDGFEFNGIPSDEFEKMLSEGKVLDVASGMSKFVNDCVDRGYDVYGVDLAYTDKTFLGRAIAANPKSKDRLIAGDATHLPFEKPTFNTIINMYGAPNYILNPEKAKQILAEELRVLKGGGRIIVSPVAFLGDNIFPINLDTDEPEKGDKVEQTFSDELLRLQRQGKIIVKKYGSGRDSFGTKESFIIIEKVKNDPEQSSIEHSSISSRAGLLRRIRNKLNRRPK